ncbi:hypothetical protein ACT048_14130, partial [Ectopseudomonas khazarica]|uniref:hypothetical protein n=1 Tax=Ectopseudomonas khazarica TaxID=2502979 RepID=UPI001E4E032C
PNTVVTLNARFTIRLPMCTYPFDASPSALAETLAADSANSAGLGWWATTRRVAEQDLAHKLAAVFP